MSNEIEYRSAQALHPDGDKAFVRGQAIVFGQETVLGKDRFGTEYREVVEPGAFDGVDLSGVTLKYNHSKDKAAVLARQSDKSLVLEQRSTGLLFAAELRSNLGKDVYAAVKSGDISGCSFGFFCAKDHYEQRSTCIVRHIDKFEKLNEISIVDDPAYKQTTVEARSGSHTPEWISTHEKQQEERQRLLLLTYC